MFTFFQFIFLASESLVLANIQVAVQQVAAFARFRRLRS